MCGKHFPHETISQLATLNALNLSYTSELGIIPHIVSI